MVVAWCSVFGQAYWGITVGFLITGIQFYIMLSPYLCFISFLRIYLFVCMYLELMRNKQLCVLIHIRTKDEVGIV